MSGDGGDGNVEVAHGLMKGSIQKRLNNSRLRWCLSQIWIN